jgi:hypothetical protein
MGHRGRRASCRLWATLGTAVAQKAAAPKPQDKLAIGEDEVKQLLLLMKQLLLLMDTDKKARSPKRIHDVYGSGVRKTG